MTRIWDRLSRANIGPRVAVIAVGVPCLYLITARGGLFFLLLVDLIILLGLHEFYNLMAAKGYRPSRLLGAVGGVALSLHVYRGGPAVTLVFTLFLLMVMVRQLLQPEITRALTDIAVTVLGVMYVGWLASHLVMLRELPVLMGGDPGLGAGLVYYAALVVWTCDTAAFVVGILVGRRKLIPDKPCQDRRRRCGRAGRRRPGGLPLRGESCACPTSRRSPARRSAWPRRAWPRLGDLAESMLKRAAGHEGLRRRSFRATAASWTASTRCIFAAPVVYYYFRFFVM